MGKSFLDGRVTVTTLKRFDAVPSTGIGPLGRIVSMDGEMAVLCNGPELHYVATAEFLPGTTRGNHLHLIKDQWLYVINGELDVTVAIRGSEVRQTFTMHEGDMVHIAAGIAHAFTSRGSSLAVEASGAAYDPSDTLPCVLV
jgi:quercetin dioxygenase-like cupin family protein